MACEHVRNRRHNSSQRFGDLKSPLCKIERSTAWFLNVYSRDCIVINKALSICGGLVSEAERSV